MFRRHRWEKAEGTVVASRSDVVGGGEGYIRYTFVIDVRTAGGELFRAPVDEPRVSDFFAPRAGRVVGVEVREKDRKVRFDMSDPRVSLKAVERAQKAQFEQALAEGPETPPA